MIPRSSVHALGMLLACGCSNRDEPPPDWRVTGGGPGNSRNSELVEINRDNVAKLRVAWTYNTGDLPANGRGEIQATPIIIGGVLYTTTPALAVVALRGDSGTLIWKFTPPAGRITAPYGNVNRGVVYWADSAEKRILYTAGRHLYALDARSGQLIPTFGDSGSVDLSKGLSRDIGDEYLVATSPGVIHRDLLIQGMRLGEGEGAAPGDIRAFDVRTGAIRWTFHTIPHPGEPGHETWPADAWKTAGGANNWAGMAVDVRRGIVYVPTGSATPDFYGGNRIGANLYANTLLALDAETGKLRWHFQTVHHDVWDRDLPAAPNLVTVTRNGVPVEAVAQITKTGYVFLFNRETGEPLFTIEERPVPQSDLRGEQTWPTQPHPTKPAPFARQSFVEGDIIDVSPQSRDSALKRLRSMRAFSLWQPPSREGSIVLPGFDGGGEWGGAAVDRESAVLFVNSSEAPWIARMREARTRGAASPWEFAGYERWRDSAGYPAIKPPWGTLTAIDLNTGEHRWRIPLGEHPELTARGMPITGTEQYGGPIVTAGGLVFIAATRDSKFRALDAETGTVLWEATLPAPGFATPATYAVRGKQYVVVAAGGGKLGAKSHDAYVAYTLP